MRLFVSMRGKVATTFDSATTITTNATMFDSAIVYAYLLRFLDVFS